MPALRNTSLDGSSASQIDDEIVAVALERLEPGRGRLLREYEHAPIGAAILAGDFDFLAGGRERQAVLFLGLDHDLRAGGRAIGAELDHAIADLAILDQPGRVAGRRGDVARVLGLAGDEFEHRLLEQLAVPRDCSISCRVVTIRASETFTSS